MSFSMTTLPRRVRWCRIHLLEAPWRRKSRYIPRSYEAACGGLGQKSRSITQIGRPELSCFEESHEIVDGVACSSFRGNRCAPWWVRHRRVGGIRYGWIVPAAAHADAAVPRATRTTNAVYRMSVMILGSDSGVKGVPQRLLSREFGNVARVGARVVANLFAVSR